MIGLLEELEQEVASPEPAAASPESAAGFETQAQELVQAWEAELATDPTPSRTARLHYEVARLYEGPLRDSRRATAHYQEAHQRAPEHLPTIRGARRTLISRNSFQAALPLFDAEVRLTADPHRKAALYYEKGRLLEDRMGNREDARKAYATALELDRSDAAILKAIEQGEQFAEDWEALDRTYEREANAVSADPRHRAALIMRRAALLEDRQHRSDEAIELYETALKLDRESHAAIAALKRLHHGQKRWRDLIRVLELEAAQTQDPALRSSAHYQVGRLNLERLGNQAEALAAFEKAREVAPDDPLVLTELAHLYESAERWGAMAEVLERTVSTLRDAADRASMLARLGLLHEERLQNEQEAVRWYEAALEVEPTFVPVLQALGKIYKQRGQWEALLKMHLREADASDDRTRRAASYALVADIYEERLAQSENAIDQHRRALAQVPGYAPSFKALTRLFNEGRQWRELIELYERAVDRAGSTDQAVTYLLKIGALYEDSLSEPVQATHTYRRVLTLNGDHLGAIQSLQRATERAGRYDELVEALELEAEKTADQGQIVALLHRAGEVLDDKLADREGALVRFRRVLGVDPTYVPALISLGRIYYRMGRWEDLLEMFKRELELTTEGPRTVTLLLKMGELCEKRIGRDDEALSYFRRAVEEDPTGGPALRALGRKLRQRGDWADYARLLETKLTTLDDDADAARIAYRLGEVYEDRLDDLERAATFYERALELRVDYRPARDALGRLRAGRAVWSKLAEDLAEEASRTVDSSLAVSALMRQGDIWAAHLDQPRRAIVCFEDVLEREPGHVGALLALEGLYRRIGAWEELARVYEAQARTLADLGGRVAALCELGRLQEMRAGAVTGDASQTYDAILDLVEGDALALSSLERLALERGDRKLLLRVDNQLANLADDPTVRAAYLARLGETCEITGQSAQALEHYRAALKADPENLGATRGLSRLAEQTDDPVALAEAARREADIASDGSVAARLLVRSAALRMERLSDHEGAQSDLERALELAPDHPEAAARLADSLVQAGQPGRLADLLARAAGSATSPDRSAALWTQVAELQFELLDNLPGAIGSLNRVLKRAPNHVPTLRRLAELYERDGQWTEAVNLLTRIVQLSPPREVLRDAHLQLAGIWDERLGETSRALVSLQAVLALDGNHRGALAQLSGLLLREGRIEQAAETASRLAQVAAGPAERADAYMQLALTQKEIGNAQEYQRALFESVANGGPVCEAALELKSQLASPVAWDRYASALVRYLELARPSGVDLTPVFLELAWVKHDHMEQPKAAIDLLKQGLDDCTTTEAVRLELAGRLRREGSFDEAIDHLRHALEENPVRPDTWRDMSRSFQAMGRPDAARISTVPLLVLGAASPDERQDAEATLAEQAQGTRNPVDAELLARLLHGDAARSAGAALLAGIAPALPKLFPPELEAFGLSSRDRVSGRQGHALQPVVEEVAAGLGVEQYELYVHRVRNRGMAVELSHPPSILVPSRLGELPKAEAAFTVARHLALVAVGLHPLDKLTARELEVLLAAAARTVNADFGRGLTNDDILEDQSRRLQRALPRRARKNLEALATRYVEAPRLDVSDWVRHVQREAMLIASVLCGDLRASVEVVRRDDREHGSLNGQSLVAASPVVSELVRFWVSPTAFDLRAEAGMLPAP